MTDVVMEVINILKSPNSPKKVYNTLLRVHSEIIPSEAKLKTFQENDGVSLVIQFLSKPNEKILNISLGILARCCSDEESRNKILSDGIKHVITILRFVKDDRIHYRCYKLISNLIDHSDLCSTIILNNHVLQSLVSVLEGNPSLFTRIMAINTVKRIWMASNITDRKTVVRSNIISTVIKHLSSDEVEVQKAVLKVIYCVSKTRSYITLKEAFQEDTLKNLISKTPQFPMLTLPIINYLSVMKYFHFELAKADALEISFEQIRKINFENMDTENETTTELVLRSVRRLCNEPKCREKLCSIPDAFDILLNICENSSHTKFKKYSILILTSFIYDEYSLRRLVKQRLIIILVSYLQIVVDDEGTPHDNNECKSENINLSSSPSSSGRVSPLSDCETLVTMSPSPTSERYGFSPALTENSDYSPVYSPVLENSDSDDVEEECEKLSIDDMSSKTDSPLIPDDDEDVKPVIEEKIFNLLKHLTYGGKPVYDLCVQRTWETFLNYLVLVRKATSHVTTLLSCIAGCTHFFNYLLKSQFPLIVHRKLCRPIHTDCSICREMDNCGTQILQRFLTVAESSYGHQILRNELLQSNNQKFKMSLVLMIPHVVKNLNQLEEYFLRYKLLNYIVESLNENDDDEYPLGEKVACLYSLATNLYVEDPRTPCNLCKKCDVASLVKEGTISFLLDDGSTITANKRSLCEKSEFFEAMFRCGFKEAKQSTVRLKNITSDCLRVLFRLLYSYCDCIVPRNMVVLLELIIQSDRFLVPELPEKLLNITMNSRLNHLNCHLIYNWAKEHGSFLLSFNEWPICLNVVKYVLADNEITFNQRVNSFRMLLKSEYKSSFLEDIVEIMECRLKSKDNKIKSSSKGFSEAASKKCKQI